MHPLVLPIAAVVAVGGGVAAYLGLHKKDAPAAAKPTATPGTGGGTPQPTNSGPAAPPASIPQAAPAPATPAPPPKSNDPTRAKVTTQDKSPAGDLNVFSGVGGSKIGGVKKDETVEVITWNAGNQGGFDWAYIRSGGTKEYPAVTGYVHRKYLVP